MDNYALFTIDGIDFTSHIVVPSYKVNQLDDYEEWVDGNKVVHRHIYRQKVVGTFTIFFDTISEFELFINTINSNKNSQGYIPNVSLYLNNKMTVASVDIYIDVDLINDLPLFGKAQHDGYLVTVTER